MRKRLLASLGLSLALGGAFLPAGAAQAAYGRAPMFSCTDDGLGGRAFGDSSLSAGRYTAVRMWIRRVDPNPTTWTAYTSSYTDANGWRVTSAGKIPWDIRLNGGRNDIVEESLVWNGA